MPEPSLPQPLLEQLDRFGGLCKSALDNANIYVQEPLHHFSSANSALSILQNKNIRATRAFDLQDNFEVNYGRQCAEDLLRITGRGASKLVQSFCNVLQSRLQAAFNPFEFYVASFTTSANSTRLWTEYADQKRGFCISFAPGFFTHTKTPPAQLKPNEKIVIAKVCYGDQKIAYRQQKIIDRAVAVLNTAATSPHILQRTLHNKFMTELTIHTATILIFNCLCAKQQHYDYEQETRLIILGGADELAQYEEMGPPKKSGQQHSRFIPIPFDPWPADVAYLTVGAASSRTDMTQLQSVLDFSNLSPADQKLILRHY